MVGNKNGRETGEGRPYPNDVKIWLGDFKNRKVKHQCSLLAPFSANTALLVYERLVGPSLCGWQCW